MGRCEKLEDSHNGFAQAGGSGRSRMWMASNEKGVPTSILHKSKVDKRSVAFDQSTSWEEGFQFLKR